MSQFCIFKPLAQNPSLLERAVNITEFTQCRCLRAALQNYQSVLLSCSVFSQVNKPEDILQNSSAKVYSKWRQGNQATVTSKPYALWCY